MNPPSRLIQLARIDSSHENERNSVLLQASRLGPSDLDLKLVATEGTLPFVAFIREDDLQSLRSSKFRGSAEEWKNIVFHLLGCATHAASLHDYDKAGLEAVASISRSNEAQAELSIALRKRVGGITQRLGTIILSQDDDEEIELYDWAASQVIANALDEEKILKLGTELKSALQSLHAMETQVVDLLNLKEEHEKGLVAKFVSLLNEKKLKLRKQQRLLENASQCLPSDVLKSASSASQTRKTGTSRYGKRKPSRGSGLASVSASDSDDGGLEALNYDPSHLDRPIDSRGAGPVVTNFAGGSESGSESRQLGDARIETSDSDEGDDAGNETDSEQNRSLAGAAMLISTSDSSSVQSEASRSVVKTNLLPKASDLPHTPPKRELPFTRRNVGTGLTTSETFSNVKPPSHDARLFNHPASDEAEDDDEL